MAPTQNLLTRRPLSLTISRIRTSNMAVAPSHSPGLRKFHLMSVRMASTQATRALHSSSNRPSPSEHLTFDNAPHLLQHGPPGAEPEDMAKPAPLAILPLTNILRSLMTTTVSSSPLLLPPSLAVMSILSNTTNPLLNPDRNPLLRFFLKKTFYAQFCAGETPAEVRQTIASLKQIGFSGVILGYAKEVVLPASSTTKPSTATAAVAENIDAEVRPWATGTLETVRLASPGDFVALKFTGAGQHALHTLTHRLPPSQTLAASIDEICALAAARGVRLLFDAEQHAVQDAINDWTMTYMRKYNANAAKKAVVYGTYQAYLKSCAGTLSEHLGAARAEGFTLGVKLVRGAYMGSDPRRIFHDTKADTDAAYDGIAEALVRREWLAPLAGEGPFPEVNLVVASHNAESVRKARAVLEEVGNATETAFAQLQGMADEVSCELVSGKMNGKGAGAYKYLVWGTTGECMKYLLRRAQENKDAVQRTKSGRDAMRGELIRRVKGVFGFR